MSAFLRTSSRRSAIAATFHPTSSYRLRSTCPPATRIASVRERRQRRYLHPSSSYHAQKGAQDKDSLKPRSTEYSQSGGGDDAAATESAFDPSSTSPEQGTKQVEKESGGGGPMNASPGNPHISKKKTAENSATAKSSGEAGEGSARDRTSGKGS